MQSRTDAAALLSVAASLENAAELLRNIVQPASPSSLPNSAPTSSPTPLLSLPLPPHDSQRVVIALFDYTCIGLEPWRTRGFEVHAYDRRHPPGHTITAAGIHLHGIDLSTDEALESVVENHTGREVSFAMAYPPCTDLSRAGARYWKKKGEVDPHFQDNATDLVKRTEKTLKQLSCPYYIENPSSSTLRNLWRPPDHTFEPCWYGGYLAATDTHPKFPAHVPNQDAYTKRTGLWVGGGFHQMPPQRRVEPTFKEWTDGTTGKKRRVTPILYSGGMEGKEARHATPRGFSEAIAQMYARA